ncbi:hypothetical protein KUH32_03700 [Thalassococcus sp. CAU 1522]|uniref:50S ribosomal protein L35 n=1 Tax=Thalassococcus arenae TaxID=2851652 RepID=A0ABS6N4B6_9RHOB|nr:hypothetical protein [Thalassococcus arenae]MBV2358867.1 hypothetical protein [Thalassococcus arenae]
MDPDTALVVALVIGVLSIPAIVSAFSEGRSPRVAAFVLIAAGALAVYAINQSGGYALHELPDVVFRVIAKFTG